METTRQTQNIILKSRFVILRPPQREDWQVMENWSNELQFLYFDLLDDNAGYKLEHLQQLYRGEDREPFHFIIEFDGRAVGGCWLQHTDLPRIVKKFPNLDCRRIDLYLAESELWDRGVGTEVVRMLTELGFETEHADTLFACDVSDADPRIRKAFEKNGYMIFQVIPKSREPGSALAYDLMLMRETYEDRSIS